MSLINVVGDLGSGKTIFVVDNARKTKLPVYSNFEIKIPNYNNLNPEDLIGLRDGSFVALDEAYTWLESRASSGKALNKYMSYILFLSRKFNMQIWTTDQLIETIDVRFRMMANYEVQCEAVPNGFKYRIFKLSRYKKPIVRTYIMSYEYAKNTLFHLYNSYAPVEFMDEDLLMNITKDKTPITDEIAKIAYELTQKAPAKDYTLRIVKSYCLDNKIHMKKADLIFNKLQEMKLNDKYQERRI